MTDVDIACKKYGVGSSRQIRNIEIDVKYYLHILDYLGTLQCPFKSSSN